jgi:SAM-dependent methyltransferase
MGEQTSEARGNCSVFDLREAARVIEAESGLYTGGPIHLFERVGRHTFVTALVHGLLPHHRLLDFGAGCLRLGFWFVRFLDSGRYYAIEPEARMVEAGRRHLFDPVLWGQKAPKVHISGKCDMTHFGVPFDFVIARSILTHTTPAMLAKILDEFALVAAPKGQFLASYWPLGADHEGPIGDSLPMDDWRFIKVVKYSLAYMTRLSEQRGLRVDEVSGGTISDQVWLRFTKAA